jgi:protein TonB
MLRPLAHVQPPRSKTARIAALAAAGAIELALVGALVSGLALRVVKDLPHELAMVDLTPTPEPPPQTVPDVKPQMVKPQAPTVAMPVIKIQRPAPHAVTAVATPTPVAVSVSPTPVADPAPVAAIPSTALVSVMATHTTPPYPELARRMGEQGQVQLHIVVGSDGAVTGVSVSKSSGSERLDEAAKSWVLANWRYKAATVNGSAVASETEALVVFDLKTARR